MRTNNITLTLLGLLLATALGNRASAQNKNVYQVRVYGAKYASGVRVQTGFRVRGLNGIVTALHGVADVGRSSEIRVHGDNGAPEYPGTLRVARVDVEHDVALLVPSDTMALPDDGFVADATPDWKKLTKVVVIGHPLGLTKQLTSQTNLRLTPSQRLREILPPAASEKMGDRGSPDPASIIISIEGVLLPGHSGAPVIDGHGAVVGVGNGGLLGGFSNICWAVPWSEIRWSNADTNRRLKGLMAENPENLFAFEDETTLSPNRFRKKLEDDYGVAYSESVFLERAARGELPIVQTFLSAGIYPNAQDANGATALMLASENGRADVVDALIRREVDVDWQDRHGRTALMLARANGHEEIVTMLLNAHADPATGMPLPPRWIISAFGGLQGAGDYPLGGGVSCAYNTNIVPGLPIYAGLGLAARRSAIPYSVHVLGGSADSADVAVVDIADNVWLSAIIEATVLRFGSGSEIGIGASYGRSIFAHTGDSRIAAGASLRWPLSYWWSAGGSLGIAWEHHQVDLPTFNQWGEAPRRLTTFSTSGAVVAASIAYTIH